MSTTASEPTLSSDPTNPDLISSFRGFHAALDSKSFPGVLAYRSTGYVNLTYRLNSTPVSTAEMYKRSLTRHWSLTTAPSVILGVSHVPEATVKSTLLDHRVKKMFTGQAWYDTAVREIGAMKIEGGEKSEGHEMEGDLGEGGVLSVKGIHAETEVEIDGEKGVKKADYYWSRSSEDGCWRIVWENCEDGGYSDAAMEKMKGNAKEV